MDKIIAVISKEGVLKALIKGIMWAVTYYFVRRGFNPGVTDLIKYRADAFYGGLAVVVSAILTPIVTSLWLDKGGK